MARWGEVWLDVVRSGKVRFGQVGLDVGWARYGKAWNASPIGSSGPVGKQFNYKAKFMNESQQRLLEMLDCDSCRMLYEIIEEKDARIAELEAQLDEHRSNLIAHELA